jgi:hypothetical protein
MFISIVKRPAMRWVCLSSVAILLSCVFGTTASAGFLTTDPTALTKGSSQISGSDTIDDITLSLTADVDYAVYYQSASGLGLNFPGRYIYAYQFYVEPDLSTELVNLFSMGVKKGNFDIADAGFVLDPSPIAGDVYHSPDLPVSGWNPGAKSVLWHFEGTPSGANSVLPGEHSEILFFTSPNAPVTDTGTLAGGETATGMFPSPVPEPATGILVLIGAAFFAATAVGRFWRRS